jgi:hypothetical protein
LTVSLRPLAPPADQLRMMIAGAWVSQAIFVAARLGIADLVKDGPKSAAELAAATGSHEQALYRILRALASVGIFSEGEDNRFSLTPLAEPLRGDVKGSVRAFAIMQGEQWIWRSWGEILHSVRTGQPAFLQIYGMPLFEYYAQNPEAAGLSAEGHTSRSDPENAAMVATYDSSGINTLVDVGGGQGSLLASILKANPRLSGMLYEKPHMTEMAAPLFEKAGLAERCEIVAGDFFVSVPKGGDAYMMKKCIHDWDDDQSRQILSNVRAAIPAHGRLLLMEAVVPTGNSPSFSKLIDLLMLVYAGGRERTESEYRDLLAAAGFKLNRVIPTACPVSIVEAVPV